MNPNNLSSNDFELTIERTPNVEYKVQRANIPGITASPIEVPSPLGKHKHNGSQLLFSEFNITFLADADFENYMEIYNWLRGLNTPENLNQYKDLKESEFGLYSDITLIVIGASKRPTFGLEFKNCFPVSISDIDLNITDTEVTYPEVSVSFQYDYFTINRKL